MFNKYFGRYPLMNEVKPTNEQIAADKAAVLSRIEESGGAKPRRDRTVRPELYEIHVPKEQPRKIPAAEVAGKAAAVALAFGAGAFIVNLFAGSAKVPVQPSAGAAFAAETAAVTAPLEEAAQSAEDEKKPHPGLITKKFNCRREPMSGDLLINNEPHTFTDDMTEFRQVGLSAEKTESGEVLLTRNDDEPDFYYFMVEFPYELGQIAVFTDTDGGGRVLRGARAVSEKANGVNETGAFHYPNKYMYHLIDGSVYSYSGGFSGEARLPGDNDRYFIKRFYAVSVKGKALLNRYVEASTLRMNATSVDIFELENGEFIFYTAPDWYDLYSVQCNSHGGTNVYYYTYTHPDDPRSHIDFADYFDCDGNILEGDADRDKRARELSAKYLSGSLEDEYTAHGLAVTRRADGTGEPEYWYCGEKVRYLCDFYQIEGLYAPSTYALYQHYSEDGTVDLYARRRMLNDTEKGELICFREATDEQFAALKPEYFQNGIAIPTYVLEPLLYDEPIGTYSDTSRFESFKGGFHLNGAKDLPLEELQAKYGAFGVTYDADKNPIYEGEAVRYFCDLIRSEGGADRLTGKPEYDILYASYNENGTVDLYTVYDESGTLTGLRVADQAEFDIITGVMTQAE